jgi:hypothetical protein
VYARNHETYFRLLVVTMAFMWGRRNVANLCRYLDAPFHRTRFNNFFGSCVIRVHRATMDTHPLYQLRCDPFRIDQGFIRGHIEMQVPLMDPAESPQVGRNERGVTRPSLSPVIVSGWVNVTTPLREPSTLCLHGARRVLHCALKIPP